MSKIADLRKITRAKITTFTVVLTMLKFERFPLKIHTSLWVWHPGGYSHRNAIRGCAAQMGRFLTKNP